jgi:hypothetical protein
MLKKTITYENPFTGESVTEEHYFHISKADLVEMEMEEHKDTYTNQNGEKLTGMQAKLQRIVDSEDGKAIMHEFKDMIRRSYGRKEGDRFLKSPDIWTEFSSTEAFSQLLFDLCTNATAAAEFVNGIVPGNLEKVAEEVRERAEQLSSETPAQTTNNGDNVGESERRQQLDKATPEDPVTLTESDLREMDLTDVKLGLGSGKYQL